MPRNTGGIPVKKGIPCTTVKDRCAFGGGGRRRFHARWSGKRGKKRICFAEESQEWVLAMVHRGERVAQCGRTSIGQLAAALRDLLRVAESYVGVVATPQVWLPWSLLDNAFVLRSLGVDDVDTSSLTSAFNLDVLLQFAKTHFPNDQARLVHRRRRSWIFFLSPAHRCKGGGPHPTVCSRVASQDKRICHTSHVGTNTSGRT